MKNPVPAYDTLDAFVPHISRLFESSHHHRVAILALDSSPVERKELSHASMTTPNRRLAMHVLTGDYLTRGTNGVLSVLSEFIPTSDEKDVLNLMLQRNGIDGETIVFTFVASPEWRSGLRTTRLLARFLPQAKIYLVTNSYDQKVKAAQAVDVDLGIKGIIFTEESRGTETMKQLAAELTAHAQNLTK